MNKKRICSYLCVVSIVAMIVATVVIVGLNSTEIVREVEIQNEDGTAGTAFVVFRPGITSFNEDVVNGFINGLVDADWRVEVTTCSTETPTNVTAYDLIILGAPVNGGQPHASMLAYLSRVDLGGKPIVLILTSGGAGGPGLNHLGNATEDANGVVGLRLQYTILEFDAASRAYTTATEIMIP